MAEPEISVIVPVYNEAPRLEENFDSLVSQVTSPPYEIIYVDDSSTDGSLLKLMDLASRHPNVRVHKMQRREPVGSVLATGVMLSHGKIIAIMGADCVAPPDWLSHSKNLEGDIAVVGFPVVPPTDLECLHYMFVYKGTGQYKPGQMPHGVGALLRKDFALEAGNFPPVKLGEDTRLFAQISKSGRRILLLNAPAIRPLPKRTTLLSHLKRYFFVGAEAGRRSRVIYLTMIVAIASLAYMAIFVDVVGPWARAFAALAAYGLVANPSRVLFYTRNFQNPRSALVRTCVFAGIKTAETLSILAGFLYANARLVRADFGRMPSVES